MLKPFATVALAILMLSPASAANILRIDFTGTGTITDSRVQVFDDIIPPTPEELGLPPLGTSVSITGSLLFRVPVPDTGFHKAIRDFGDPFEGIYFFTGFFNAQPAAPGTQPVRFATDEPWGPGAEILSIEDGRLVALEFASVDADSCGVGREASMDFFFLLVACDFDYLAYYSGSWALTSQTVFTDGIPEPGSWALMLAGFGLVGIAARRRRVKLAA